MRAARACLLVPHRKRSPHGTLAEERRLLLAARVRAARTAANLTQDQLAGAARLGRAQVQRIERAEANPTLATLYAVAGALNVSVVDLLAE